jgi:predicted DNA-binding antitoxin AbrB/MazE fold protein
MAAHVNATHWCTDVFIATWREMKAGKTGHPVSLDERKVSRTGAKAQREISGVSWQMTNLGAGGILGSMSHSIPAIFDAGVFRPLVPVDLANGTQVDVQLPAAAPTAELSPDELARQQAAIEEMLAEIESLPIEEPDDGFSGRDHDQILYGAP